MSDPLHQHCLEVAKEALAPNSECSHGEEPDYCDCCRYDWEKRIVPAVASALETELRAERKLSARWKKAIEGLTPSGSEFVDDPETCAAYIRERWTSSHERLVAMAKQVKAMNR
jgi:hypothetical protein